jgi:DNA polymerase II large subunit
MILVNNFLAPGTHIRTERPGKGSIVAPVDSIEGPIVLLKNGSVVQVYTVEEAKQLEGKIKRILYLGDILVALGEFLENNHPLVPSGYCEEWWSHNLDIASSELKSEELDKKVKILGISQEELDSLIQDPLSDIPNAELAIRISKAFSIPLHPRYLYRWEAITPDQLLGIRKWILSNHSVTDDGKMQIPNDKSYKELLETLGIPHKLTNRRSTIEFTDPPIIILTQLGKKSGKPKGDSPLAMLNSVSKIQLRDRLGFSIGARMGRPEKAEERRMRPPVHALFPVGRTTSSERNIEKVAKSVQPYSTLDEFAIDSEEKSLPSEETPSGSVRVELVSRYCIECNTVLFESKCPRCGSHTHVQKYCSEENCGQPVNESGLCPRNHDMNLIRSTRRINLPIRSLIDSII